MAEQMKPSGIEWIKDIPSSWEINKVKYLATEPGTLFLDGDWIESDVIEESGIRYLTTGNVGAGFYKEQGSGYISEKTFSELHCLNVYPGDLMISRLNEPIGRACIIPDTESRYVVAVDNVILRPNANYNKKFIMYGMNADGYAEHANMIARGATMSRISRSQLGQFWLAFPNIEEQQAIVDFLDKECAQIDSIAADLEKQIALLQKYKKSLITEIVTKGLDKSVPMKDSGVEWAQHIPTHWKTTRMQEVGKYKKGPFGSAITLDMFIEKDDTAIKIYEQKNAIQADATLGWYYISERDFSSLTDFEVFPGDIIVSCAGTIGKCYIMPDTMEKGIINQALMKITLYQNVDSNYFLFLFDVALEYMANKYSNGSAIKNIPPFSVLKKQHIPLPGLEEQKKIASYLCRQSCLLNGLIDEKRQQLQVMQEHKKSLIYEYVTGKKRVKEVR